MIKKVQHKSDFIGAIASGLCMIHCLATPFIFLATVCSESCCASAPAWWRWLDFVFLFVSFFAVYRSVKTTYRSWIKPALWISWGALFVFVVFEQFRIIDLPAGFKYSAAFSLIGVHLYNLISLRRKSNACCTQNG